MKKLVYCSIKLFLITIIFIACGNLEKENGNFIFVDNSEDELTKPDEGILHDEDNTNTLDNSSNDLDINSVGDSDNQPDTNDSELTDYDINETDDFPHHDDTTPPDEHVQPDESVDTEVNDETNIDACPDNPNKEEPGFCGCDKAEGSCMPIILMAGQSNMVGSLPQDLLDNILQALETTPDNTLQATLEQILSDWYHNYNDGYAMYGYSEEMVTFEAEELIRLKNAGLLSGNITTPYSKYYCSMNDNTIEQLSTNCGNPFGPELMLGHYIGAHSFPASSLIKVAKGGSNLFLDWRSPTTVGQNGGTVGEYYTKLKNKISSIDGKPTSINPQCIELDCFFGAFIWFQGENDTFDQQYAENYEENLRNFIKDVRSEIGNPELPVIIIEIGAWAQSMEFGAIVSQAQQAFVASDPFSEIVITDDLSGYYHYDPAAQFIIGERTGIVLIDMFK